MKRNFLNFRFLNSRRLFISFYSTLQWRHVNTWKWFIYVNHLDELSNLIIEFAHLNESLIFINILRHGGCFIDPDCPDLHFPPKKKKFVKNCKTFLNFPTTWILFAGPSNNNWWVIIMINVRSLVTVSDTK